MTENEEYYLWEQKVDAQNDGYRAYQNGLNRNDNPFNNNDEWDLHLAWLDGYMQAAQDD